MSSSDAWVVVPCLNEARDQLNARFPGRDKTSDGSIGNLAHQGSPSSHNPDRTGNPEWRDGDALNEVRARDFDADLRDPGGVTMEHVVQLWVRLARAGKLPFVRYIIFNRRIWHVRDGFTTRAYTGSNAHDKHCHVNSEYSQAADTARGTDWGLDGLKKPAAPKPPATGKPAPGPALAWPLPSGHYFGPADGPAQSVSGRYLRSFRGRTDRAWIKAFATQLSRRGWSVGKGKQWLRRFGNDGQWGDEYTDLVEAFQRDQGLRVDGLLGPVTWKAAFRNPVR